MSRAETWNASPEPRKHIRGRSFSPDSREWGTGGGGRSSSRRRSPGYYRDEKPARSPHRGDRDGDRRGRRDQEGSPSGDRRRRDRRPRDDGYDDRERERERAEDRKTYDEVAKRDGEGPVAEPEKPNFGLSGLLAKETNTVKGVQLKYNEPPEARKPLKNWRLYVFKGTEQIDLVHIYKQSCYLVGRDTIVTDIPIAHPSCSKQHAVIQFRQINEKNEYGEVSTSVKPFIIDLESTNGTYVNDQEVPKTRYYELRVGDVVKFGTSSREYVLLHEEVSA